MAIVVLMGVAGAGKTEVGRALARRLAIEFVDADDYHTEASLAKMRNGVPLADEDRLPWLRLLAARVERAWVADRGLVLACSALRRRYRRILCGRAGSDVLFVHLVADRELLLQRMGNRQGHFMPATLLDSQLASLEPPAPGERSIELSAEQPVETLVTLIVKAMGEPAASAGADL